jgi:hypothetical protein
MFTKIIMTKEDIKTYLIDCTGYSEEDLKDLTKDELLDLVDDREELFNYLDLEGGDF